MGIHMGRTKRGYFLSRAKEMLSIVTAVAMLTSIVGPVGAFATEGRQASLVTPTTEILESYNSFSAANMAGLQMTGSAAVSGGAVRLTPALPDQIGGMFAKQAIHLKNNGSFSTHFAFRVSDPDPDNGGSDGFAFVIAEAVTAEPQLGGGGGNLGYAGIPGKSVAVEFDTYQNEWDPNGNHIGYQSGMANAHIETQIPPVDMSDGGVKYVWIDYTDSGALDVRISDTDIRPATSLINCYSSSLPCIYPQSEGDFYVGFTGATGGGYENHDILSWQFDNKYVANMGSDTYDMGPAVALDAVANPTSLGFGETSEVTFTLTDEAGVPTPGETLAVSAPYGGTVSTDTVTTDSSGKATATFTAPNADGTCAVRAATSNGLVDGAAIKILPPPPSTRVSKTIRASVDAEGMQGVDEEYSARGSKEGYISSTGRYVMFYTGNGLVAEDTNGYPYAGQDWYRKDTQTGDVTLVSVGVEGEQSNSNRPYNTIGAAVSTDGRYVAFADFSSNLVDGDTNNVTDVFYRDLQLGVTQRISVDGQGNQGSKGSRSPVISDSGRYVAFRTGSALVEDDTNGSPDIYVRDMGVVPSTIERVSVATDGSEGAGYCDDPDISADGRFVTFTSDSTNLVDGDDNECGDVFVHDRTTGETTRVSVNSANEQGHSYSWHPTISGDGRYVAFASDSSNLAPEDYNESRDVFVRDRQTGTTTCVSLDELGDSAGGDDPDISANGRFVAYEDASRRGPARTDAGGVSANINTAGNILVRDLKTGTTSFATVAADGGYTNSSSWGAEISADGRKLVYTSDASNIVTDDTNDATDVFEATIVPVNSAPVAVANSYTTREDTVLSVTAPGLLGNDTDAEDDALTAKLASGAHHGEVKVNANGSFTYAPNANFNGSDSFAYRAYDGTAYSAATTVTVSVTPVIDSTSITVTSESKTLGGYGNSYAFTGKLLGGGVALGGKRVVLQSSATPAGFVDTGLSAITGANGTFSIPVTPRSATYYRARFAATSEYVWSTSAVVRVVPRAWVSTPEAPAVMTVGESSSVTGILKPAHAAGTQPVRIYKYRYVSGAWTSAGYVNATAADSSGVSGYSAKVSLPAAGKWRLRAYSIADAKHAAAWSTDYEYVTVRTRGARAVAIAKTFLGAEYQWGAVGPTKFDSSGFVRYVYARMGVLLPRTAAEQYLAGPRVSTSSLQPGDLVFYYTPVSHVGIYVGDGLMIDCNHSGGGVGIRSVYPGLVGATRPWTE